LMGDKLAHRQSINSRCWPLCVVWLSS